MFCCSFEHRDCTQLRKRDMFFLIQLFKLHKLNILYGYELLSNTTISLIYLLSNFIGVCSFVFISV